MKRGSEEMPGQGKAVTGLRFGVTIQAVAHLIKEEIRKYKWIEGEKGRKLSWERARQEWTDVYREKFEKFLIDTLYFSDATPEEPPAEGRAKPGDKSVVFVPLKSGA